MAQDDDYYDGEDDWETDDWVAFWLIGVGLLLGILIGFLLGWWLM